MARDAARAGRALKPSLTDTLCTQCGLCCDGSLFADVELAGSREATALEILGLEVEDAETGGPVLVQPCAALRGTRCSIYAHRPQCCRTFECRLLRDVRGGLESVEQAERHIADARAGLANVRRLLAEVGERATRLPLRERVAEALAADRGARPQLVRVSAELEAAMAALEALLRARFLGESERAT